MPPQFQVIRCYKCSTFQGHQTTKSNKWECKICGEKQSFKRFYGLGTAKECRFQVQKLNSLRGQLDEKKNNTDENSNFNKSEEIATKPVNNYCKPVQNSKWSNYIDETETVEGITTANIAIEGKQAVFQVPVKKRKLSSNNFKSSLASLEITTKEENNDFNSTSPKIVPNSLINSKVIKLKSKASHPTFHFGDSIPQSEPLNVITNNNCNKFVPSVSNRNSRWARFTDEPHETEQMDSILTPKNDMFLCTDDEDIESILGI